MVHRIDLPTPPTYSMSIIASSRNEAVICDLLTSVSRRPQLSREAGQCDSGRTPVLGSGSHVHKGAAGVPTLDADAALDRHQQHTRMGACRTAIGAAG